MGFFPLQGLSLEINELRYRISEMETERMQYEKKLKSTKVSWMIDIYLSLLLYQKRNDFYFLFSLLYPF